MILFVLKGKGSSINGAMHFLVYLGPNDPFVIYRHPFHEDPPTPMSGAMYWWIFYLNFLFEIIQKILKTQAHETNRI